MKPQINYEVDLIEANHSISKEDQQTFFICKSPPPKST